ncbi:hypothetical protein FM106_20100 [Brachybacterium faecium]|uniref:DUF3039 domain-containing protein n=1 Tax=Brachybacterium faecium (strain ATCC 43885 / DSM 4810 / JCM 11609 / LMG 19847 / NBRC 14762 / NCIMB 9860 / 6-10) TaxID=446465 RepID=C7ME13_BRAFD|nr:DUF3039 domain-containing protein [Brachybacterium faecium]ACU85820.1 hypothetical protein Bfae_20120 [Brachybacterium faecium DSM 4810]SLN01073.1 hypothetical protein FM106_20100 [Brachybacterium faecium]HJG53119.1 DUF3039 domain-containing protein [Brachybacterium faecium]
MSSTSDPSRMDPYSDDPGAAPGSTAVLDRQLQEQEQSTDDGDHDRFAHYVRKNKITQAALGGTPVIALCGKVWVPGRDPEKYPVCPECKEIYDGMREPNDGGDGTGGSGRGGGFRGFFGGRR